MIRQCLTAGVDHLHAVKVLVVDNGLLHVASPSSLARGALENFATAYWILGPKRRDDRIERSLKWHAQNMKDQENAVGRLGMADHQSLESKLKKLRLVADSRGIETKSLRAGYQSTAVVKYSHETAPDLPLGVLLPWKICSGFAHGRPWTYLGMSDLEFTDTDDPEVQHVRLTSDLGRALYPSLAALQLLEQLLRLYRERSAVRLAES